MVCMGKISLGSARVLKKHLTLIEMSSDFNFTVASWFLGNVHVKPISTHSATPPPSKMSPHFTLIYHYIFLNCGPYLFKFVTSYMDGPFSKEPSWNKQAKKIKFSPIRRHSKSRSGLAWIFALQRSLPALRFNQGVYK